jgi:hypothetical protein
MASSYTPGPWEIDRDRAGSLLGVTPRLRRPGDAPVCFTPPIVANAEADARLIAASPDLLEALDWLLASIEADPKGERYPGDGEERLLLARASARAAIAKATGSDQ